MRPKNNQPGTMSVDFNKYKLENIVARGREKEVLDKEAQSLCCKQEERLNKAYLQVLCCTFSKGFLF
jgi:hypothetical protein